LPPFHRTPPYFSACRLLSLTSPREGYRPCVIPHAHKTRSLEPRRVGKTKQKT
jgi:hypothetical protein